MPLSIIIGIFKNTCIYTDQSMQRIILFIILLVSIASPGATYAQFPYKLSTLNEPYKPLSGGTNITSLVWFNDDFFAMPMPFGINMDTVHCTIPFIEGGSTIVTDTGKNIVSSFFLTDANLIDKGFSGSDLNFLSPIRYEIFGDTGNRIFKLEIANAAFFNEIVYGTTYDSVYMQIWLYETTNMVELRYGPSHVSHGYNYFPNKGFPGIGYIQDVDSSLNGMYYILGGDPVSPFVESILSTNGVLASKPSGLNSFPVEGTVYRFTPVKLYVDKNAGHLSETVTKVYPTTCNNDLIIEYTTDRPNDKAYYNLFSETGVLQLNDVVLPNMLNHVDVGGLTPGIYILQLQTSKGIDRQKIIKI